METFVDALRDRFGNSAYEFRLESFKKFLRAKPREYKESPTTKDYVSISEGELEMLMGSSAEAGSAPIQTERHSAPSGGDILLVDGELQPVREISKVTIADLNSVSCNANRGTEVFMRVGKEREEHLINASWKNGYYVQIEDDAGQVNLDIENVYSGDFSIPTKSFIECGDNNSVIITDSYSSGKDNSNVFGKNIYIVVGKNSRVTYNYIQDKADHSTDITFVRSFLSEGAEFRIFHLNSGSSKVIFHNESEMIGDNSTFRTHGVSFSSDKQGMDIRDSSFQTGLSTHADISVKGAVTGESITMHRGNIDIEEVSVQSTGFYDSKLLLLSDKAYANSKPALIILNNNTRSKHGSAISSVDEDELFYLQSRGVDRNSARSIITEGFMVSAVEQSGSDRLINKVHELSRHVEL